VRVRGIRVSAANNKAAMTVRTTIGRERDWGNRTLAAVLLVVVAVAFVVWWTLIRSSGESTSTTARGAVAVSQGGLETIARLGHPIYWAGPEKGFTYELTQTPDGRVYLRYLPAGTQVGSPKIFLTVATYPLSGALAVTNRVASQAGSVKVPVGDGGVAFYHRRLPTNVYVAYPGSNYQIEVFDPSPSQARRLVSGGSIGAVPTAASGPAVIKAAAVAVTPAALSKLATKLGRPVYWAGREPGKTYELTQTPDGRIYVRYLPAGVPVGAARPYLTVGTYPVANAYAVTRAASRKPGSVLMTIPGGTAFYARSRPTSVYLAFPGIDEQIEVYDPSAAAARSAVANRAISAVS
jgi:hypothetical protein